MFAPGESLCAVHFTFLCEVSFVAKENERKGCWVLWLAVEHEAALPFVEVLEAFLVSDVEYEDAAVCSAVKRVTKRLEALLTGGIPNLRRHDLVIKDKLLVAKIGTDGRLELLDELALAVLLNEGGLPDSGVADNNQFQKTLFLHLSFICFSSFLFSAF